MFIGFHFGDQNIQIRSDRDKEFHDYLRDNFGVRSIEIPEVADPIEFIKKDKGVIFRLKEVRITAN
jgi:hypothetical protein